jgi:hypothetical protein
MATTSRDGLTRRRLLVVGLGATVGGAAAVAAGSSGAQAAASARSTRPDVVSEWFEQVAATSPASEPPTVAGRVWAISWLSALTGLDGAAHRPTRRRPMFEDAAVASAVHDALVALVPEQTSRLDAALAYSLAAIPDSDAKRAGIRAGRDAAARVLSEREDDGDNPPPFLLGRADRFRPGPPPAPGTLAYRRSFNEVKRLGGVVAPDRTDLQSYTAKLWGQQPLTAYAAVLRPLLSGRSASLPWKVGLLAAFTIATFDAQIAVSDAKNTYRAPRPTTAIHAAGTDADPQTIPDPNWSPFSGRTLPSPEYPSADAGFAAAAERVLERFAGPRTPVSFTLTKTGNDGTVLSREYRRGTPWPTLTQEVADSRVWLGNHFRFSTETGVALARRVAGYDLDQVSRSPRESS